MVKHMENATDGSVFFKYAFGVHGGVFWGHLWSERRQSLVVTPPQKTRHYGSFEKIQHKVIAVIAEEIRELTKNTVLRFKRAISVQIKADVADLLRRAISSTRK